MSIQELLNEDMLKLNYNEFITQKNEFNRVVCKLNTAIDVLENNEIYATISSDEEKNEVNIYKNKLLAIN